MYLKILYVYESRIDKLEDYPYGYGELKKEYHH